MKYLLIIAFGVVLLGCGSNSVKNEEKVTYTSNKEITYDSLLKKYISNPNNTFGQNEDFYRIIAKDENNAWVYFTKNTHSAHPSYVKIYPAKKDEKFFMVMESYTWGDKDSYEKLRKEMQDFVNVLSKKYEKK